MIVSVDVPDPIARQLRLDGEQGNRRALEMVALRGCETGELTRGKVGELHRRPSIPGTAKRRLQAAADHAGGVHPAIPVAIVKRQSRQPTAIELKGCGNWVYRMKNQPVPPPLILDGQPVLLPWKMHILSVSHTA